MEDAVDVSGRAGVEYAAAGSATAMRGAVSAIGAIVRLISGGSPPLLIGRWAQVSDVVRRYRGMGLDTLERIAIDALVLHVAEAETTMLRLAERIDCPSCVAGCVDEVCVLAVHAGWLGSLASELRLVSGRLVGLCVSVPANRSGQPMGRVATSSTPSVVVTVALNAVRALARLYDETLSFAMPYYILGMLVRHRAAVAAIENELLDLRSELASQVLV